MEKIKTSNVYMQRCLTLASYGEGQVSPNPMVGAVVVYNGEIIGEGYHRHFGGPHAEVNAINSVKDQSLLKDSEMYVTLEPCAHYGKTPPCCELLVEKGIKKVYVGCEDPFPQVKGKGIQFLKSNGVEVEVGVDEEDCRFQNRRFITSIEQRRPYIILKWAESQDGYIGINKDSKTRNKIISCERHKYWTHRLRAMEDSILVGTNTALEDDPMLDTRYWAGKSPVRIVMDRKGRLPSTLKLFAEEGTLVYKLSIEEMLEDLYLKNIRSLVVEGGAELIDSFLEKGLWDEAFRYVGLPYFGSGVLAPKIHEKGYIMDGFEGLMYHYIL